MSLEIAPRNSNHIPGGTRRPLPGMNCHKVIAVHGIDGAEKVIVRKQLRRGQVMKFFAALPPCLVGMGASATAHYWARELTRLGHEAANEKDERLPITRVQA
jgi:kynurenine formamidase